MRGWWPAQLFPSCHICFSVSALVLLSHATNSVSMTGILFCWIARCLDWHRCQDIPGAGSLSFLATLLYSPSVFSIFTPIPSSSFPSPPQGDCQREGNRRRERKWNGQVYIKVLFPSFFLSFFLACVLGCWMLKEKLCTRQSSQGCAIQCISQCCFPQLNKPCHFTTPNYHSLHVKVSIHSLVRTYLMSFLHFLPPFVSNPAMVEVGKTQRMQQ